MSQIRSLCARNITEYLDVRAACSSVWAVSFLFFSAGTRLITENPIGSAFSLYLCFCLPSRLDVSLHLCLFPSVLFSSNIIQAVIALKCVESSQGLHIHPAKKKTTQKKWRCSSEELSLSFPLFLHHITSVQWRFITIHTHMFAF